ncbi:glycerophosphodiester phosphodiesterase [Gallaecimonas xiamenensis]|uniref:glycerophosphodiester phosphodiesterase n=1 Tax=Gallaecimonas xiamenensis TaxID=1207039 RepID=UPI000A05B380|nr:glycerophosphodiester phosphodiesterase family protein [Gallaecimonas xiamenensis]
MGRILALALLAGLAWLSLPATAQTLVIGHRGVAGLAPENTLSAVKKALHLGVDAVEVDIRQSKDGALVAFHDDKLERTTNGQGDVSDFTLAQLNTLDAGSWFGPQYLDEWIPTLAEVMNAMGHSRAKLIIELKVPGLERDVLEHIRTYKLQKRVIIKSFDPAILTRFAQLAPDIPRLYGFFGWSERFNLLMDDEIRRLNPLDMDVSYLQVYHSFLTPALLDEAHQRGFKVVAWGVHSRKAMESMLGLGVDGIETDYPDRLYSLMDEFKLKRLMVGYNEH